jgi:hypothetical protein
MHAKVANFARIYPWFSNMQTHFAVAHAKYLSIFDIGTSSWEHVELSCRKECGVSKAMPTL